MRVRRVVTVLGVVAVAAMATMAAKGWSLRPDPPSEVVLTLHHSHFVSAPVHARPGQAVTFVIRNDDPIDHEFILGDPSVQRKHEAGRQREHHGEVPGEVSVPAGTERRTTFRFAGDLDRVEYACHLPGHYAYGMHAWVTVDR
jgi:uncharacterized cupredoxin-like copper-binding protein